MASARREAINHYLVNDDLIFSSGIKKTPEFPPGLFLKLSDTSRVAS
jgi:hypothetical protein